MPTAIEWTNETWNPVVGCTIVSPGCRHCYAMNMAGRLEAMAEAGQTGMDHYRGTTQKADGANNYTWTGKVNVAPDQIFLRPLKWKRPRLIFVNSMSDLFHADIPDAVIDRVFAVMAIARHHTYQLLTKRSDRQREYLTTPGRHTAILAAAAELVGKVTLDADNPWPWPLPNVWLGVSVEDQKRAGERIPDLLTTPAVIRWISAEPLVSPLDLTNISTLRFRGAEVLNALTGVLEGMFGDSCATRLSALNWIVAGGESGDGARPMHPDWPRKLRDQCRAARVAFLFKQWGAWAPGGTWPYLPDAPLALKKGFATIIPSGIFHGRGYPWSVNATGREDIVRVGKKAAGRELDGREHNEYPEAA